MFAKASKKMSAKEAAKTAAKEEEEKRQQERRAEEDRRREQRAAYLTEDLRRRASKSIDQEIRFAPTEGAAREMGGSWWLTCREYKKRWEEATTLWPIDLSKECPGDAGELAELALVDKSYFDTWVRGEKCTR